MRLLERRVVTVAQFTPQTIDMDAIGARGVQIRPFVFLPDNMLTVHDGASIFDTYLAMLWPEGTDDGAFSNIFVPVLSGSLTLNNTATPNVDVTLGLYDEPPPAPWGAFPIRIETDTIVAAGTRTSAYIRSGLFPKTKFIITTDRAATITIEFTLNKVAPDLFPAAITTTIAAAGGGVATLAFDVSAPLWRYKIVNNNGANPLIFTALLSASSF